MPLRLIEMNTIIRSFGVSSSTRCCFISLSAIVACISYPEWRLEGVF